MVVCCGVCLYIVCVCYLCCDVRVCVCVYLVLNVQNAHGALARIQSESISFCQLLFSPSDRGQPRHVHRGGGGAPILSRCANDEILTGVHICMHTFPWIISFYEHFRHSGEEETNLGTKNNLCSVRGQQQLIRRVSTKSCGWTSKIVTGPVSKSNVNSCVQSMLPFGKVSQE